MNAMDAAVQGWLATAKPNTQRAYRTVFNLLTERFPTKPLDKLAPADMRAFLTWLQSREGEHPRRPGTSTKLTPNYVRQIFSRLKTLYEFLIADGHVKAS